MKEVKRSKFSGAFSLTGKVATPGRKIQTSSRPELVALTTKDKFAFNSKARKLLGLVKGDRVVLLDAFGQVDSQNERFFVAIGYTKNEAEYGAKVSKNGEFSYSGVYSAIQANDIDVDEYSVADMVREGIMVKSTTEKGNTSYTSKTKVHYEVQEMEDKKGDVIDELAVDSETIDGEKSAIFTKVYALVNVSITDHKVEGDEDDTPEDEGEEG